MNWLIPIFSGVLYRLGGSDKGNKWFRWLMGLPIGIVYAITHHSLIWIPIFTITYYIATSAFVYGDNSWVAKLIGRKGARIVHGLAFGLASLEPMFAIWVTVIFIVLFEIAERNWIDNSWSEVFRGSLGTLKFFF